ncbi:hypothetical protein RJT34_03443 [Clitoria ternatea]|uniref:Uncharacterized protein n=1 Tax=Clitoria ternatea TaxID=43366 RepID=A0AAN9KKS6_CLITE
MSASPPTEPPSSKLITGVVPILVLLPIPLSLALALVIGLGCCSVVFAAMWKFDWLKFQPVPHPLCHGLYSSVPFFPFNSNQWE